MLSNRFFFNSRRLSPESGSALPRDELGCRLRKCRSGVYIIGEIDKDIRWRASFFEIYSFAEDETGEIAMVRHGNASIGV